MIISGNSNPLDFTGGTFSQAVKIKPDFKPETQLAMTWIKLASGNYACTDRGYGSDKYEVGIEFYSTEDVINNIQNLLYSNRFATSGASQITLSSINDTEHIFGEDLDYTGTVTANIMAIEKRSQGSWKGFGLAVKLAAVSPSFIVGDGAFPTLRFVNFGYDANAGWAVRHYMSYSNSTFFNPDHQSDTGEFTGTFTMTAIEMAQIRRYIAKQRGSTIVLPDISGVQNPFGHMSTSYPYDVKIINFEDLGRLSVAERMCNITFAEVL